MYCGISFFQYLGQWELCIEVEVVGSQVLGNYKRGKVPHLLNINTHQLNNFTLWTMTHNNQTSFQDFTSFIFVPFSSHCLIWNIRCTRASCHNSKLPSTPFWELRPVYTALSAIITALPIVLCNNVVLHVLRHPRNRLYFVFGILRVYRFELTRLRICVRFYSRSLMEVKNGSQTYINMI